MRSAASPAQLSILALQRTAGNQAVAGLLAAGRDAGSPHDARDPVVQRQVAWHDGARAHTSSMLNAIVALTPFGITPSIVNQEEFPGGNSAGALFGPTIQVEDSFVGKKAKVVGQDVINVVGYRMELPVAPPWQGPVDSPTVASAIGFHTEQGRTFAAEQQPYSNHQGNTNLIVQGLPSNQTFSRLVEDHEDHHVDEVRATAGRYLVPWDARLADMRRTGETTWGLDGPSATANLYRKAGGTPAAIGTKLESEFRRLGDAFHETQEGKPPTVTSVGTKGDCSSITLFLKHPLG
ncbi:MAG: hypothetical protein ACRDJU_09790 [Actinomycetota bacterium]